MIYPTILKVCNTCQTEKPITDFYKNKKTKDGHCYTCKACVAVSQKKRRLADKERIKAHYKIYFKEFYNVNKQKFIDKKKKYILANKEKIAESQKRYRLKNREKLKESAKKRFKEFYASNKQKFIDKKKKRRALKSGATIEKFNSVDVFNRDRYICQSCGCKTRPDYKNSYHPKYPNLDHIIPLSKGGEHSMKNTQCLCHKCNMQKGSGQKQDQLLLFGY